LRDGNPRPADYQRMAETGSGEVLWQKIVQGYEYEKGK